MTRPPGPFVPRLVGPLERRPSLRRRVARWIADHTGGPRGVVVGAAVRVAYALADEREIILGHRDGGLVATVLGVGITREAITATLLEAAAPYPGRSS